MKGDEGSDKHEKSDFGASHGKYPASMRRRFCLAAALWVSALPALPAMAEEAKTAEDTSLEGVYEGSAMEVAALLSLEKGGRFRYWLSYGALDERASGQWRLEGNAILLDSDPFEEPHFTLLRQEDSATDIAISLSLPEGMDHQYFSVLAEYRDGKIREYQMTENPLLLENGDIDPLQSIRLVLPIYSIQSAPFPLDSAKGRKLTWSFSPEGLGKIRFENTPLIIDGGMLLLERHGRRISFHRVK